MNATTTTTAASGPSPARIALCSLVLTEVDIIKTRQIVTFVFGDSEKVWGDDGSPIQRWYRDMSSLSASGGGGGGGKMRQIAWKTGKPFVPRYLFFRTVDTGRLLPANNADIRVQFYAHESHWEYLDGPRYSESGNREGWIDKTLGGMMHELLVLRNRRDKGGGDIPIIVTNWDTNLIDLAISHWVELSKGQWSDEEHARKFEECDSQFCRRLLPCFSQVDILLRALFFDPEVGFTPPFVVIMPLQGSVDLRARVLYADPSNLPPRSLVESFPKSCGSIDLGATRALSAGTTMVRDIGWPEKGVVVCNKWGCAVRHSPGQGTTLQQCYRCKEVFYCCSQHQSLDWRQHKDVCEARNQNPS